MDFTRSYREIERARGNKETERGKWRGEMFKIFLIKKCCHIIKSMSTHIFVSYISKKKTNGS